MNLSNKSTISFNMSLTVSFLLSLPNDLKAFAIILITATINEPSATEPK